MPFRRSLSLSLAGAALALLVAGTASAADDVRFIGDAQIPGTGTDKSGLKQVLLEDGVSPANALNGFGSGIAYAGGNLFYALGDRGPNKVQYQGGAAVDNTVSYPNRYQKFRVQVIADKASPIGFKVTAENTGTTLLKNSQGVQYLGISTAFSTDPKIEGHRLDSEGIRVAPDGSVWISDEYGPAILHFNAAGREIGHLTVPQKFVIANPAATGDAEIKGNKTGRVNNRGAEGIALTPDGSHALVVMQSPLLQDGALKGINDRFMLFDLKHPTAAPKEFLYQLDNSNQPLSEILAINDHEFLVDERDGVAGPKGIKLLYKIDLNQADKPTDIATGAFAGTSADNGLPVTGTPNGVVPLKKTLFADLGRLLNAANPWATANGMPDKIEGIAFGPDLPNGDHLLLATNDNDFTIPSIDGYRPNYIFAFAVAKSALPGFKQEALPK